jgi:hypothetical protein
MTQNAIAETRLGELESEGYKLTITRGYNDGTTNYVDTYHEIICYGVVNVDIQDPYDIGSGDPESQIEVTFSTGEKEYIWGVITDIEINDE